MLQYLLANAFKFSVRIAALIAADLTLTHAMQLEGYRIHLDELFIMSIVVIVVVRLWMPWSRDS